MINASSVSATQRKEADQRRLRGPLRPEELRGVRQRHSRRLSAHLFHAVDAALIVAITAITVEIAFREPLLQSTLAYDLPFVAGAFVLVMLLVSLGLYGFGRRERFIAHTVRVWSAIPMALAIVIGIHWLIGGDGPSLGVSAIWAAACLVGLSTMHTWRWILVRHWRAKGWLTPNIVIVGATAQAEVLIRDAIKSTDMHVLGIFDDRSERRPTAILGVPVLGNTEALLSHKITPFVDLLVVAVDPLAAARVREITARLAILPNPVTLIFDPQSPNERVAAIAQLADAPLAPLNQALDADRRAFAKRLQDLVIAVPLLLALSPLLALVALLVRLDSPGPVFFRQRRHGFNNEEIVVWKFRTMRQDRTDARAEQQVTANDDRVTRVGRVLRKTSIDELPQLLNVIHGEMSLVGPRPHAIGMRTGDVESARLVADYAHRHRIKPGMTGWAAVNGSRGPLQVPAEVSRRVALDVDYIEHQSFWLDLKIIALTIPAVVGDRVAIR